MGLCVFFCRAGKTQRQKLLMEDFIEQQAVTLILGDNLFHGAGELDNISKRFPERGAYFCLPG